MCNVFFLFVVLYCMYYNLLFASRMKRLKLCFHKTDNLLLKFADKQKAIHVLSCTMNDYNYWSSSINKIQSR